MANLGSRARRVRGQEYAGNETALCGARRHLRAALKPRNRLVVGWLCMTWLSSLGCESGGDYSREIRGDTIVIAGEASCNECAIELRDSVTIGHESDSVALGLSVYVVRRNDGHIFATGMIGTVGVAEYDPSGRLLKVHGQQGEGPAEFARSPSRPIILKGDTLVVFDRVLQRFTRISPEGEIAGTFRSPFRPWDVDVGEDSSLIATGLISPRDPFSQGRPAHYISTEGQILRSVGDSLGPMRADQSSATLHEVAASAKGTVALVRPGRYDIDVITPDGKQRVISRRVSWFPPSDSLGARHPQITNLWIDDFERLWVTLLAPKPGAAPTGPIKSLADRALVADNIVEVMDLASGELLVSQRYPGPFGIGGGIALSPSEDHLGLIRWNVWRPLLTSRR